MQTLQVPGAPTAPSDFGPLLTTRERTKEQRNLIVGALIAGGLASLIMGAYFFTITGVKPSQSIVGGLGGLVAAACFFGNIRRMFRSVSFYQGGLVDRLFSRVRTFRYADAVGMNYSLVRQYVNGIYAGTELTLRLTMNDGQVFNLCTRHKEQPKGLSITLIPKNKTFEGEDEMDVIKDLIASYVAERLGHELAKGGPVGWCRDLRLNTQGVMPLSGKAKGTLVIWREITGVKFERGAFFLTARGENQPFVCTPCAGYNFYPCLQLFETFMQSSGATKAA
jgi:hypothetical protein